MSLATAADDSPAEAQPYEIQLRDSEQPSLEQPMAPQRERDSRRETRPTKRGTAKHDADELHALVLASQAGDESAFTELVARFQRLVYKIAYSKCSHPEDTEDICQDIFMHAHRSIPKLREPRAFLGWLIALAHNRANRYCRRRQSKRQRLEEARTEMLRQADQALRDEVSDVPDLGVSDAVRSLSDEYRQALNWKYVDGLSYEAIGERMSMSFHQVDYVLRKAKRALKAAVEKIQEAPRTALPTAPGDRSVHEQDGTSR